MDYCGPTEQDYDRLSIAIAVAAGLHTRPQDVGERMAAGYGDTGNGRATSARICQPNRDHNTKA
ncbi:hypothetical protein ASF90_06385 [Xanthomonas sp. Leaf148]|nr:hypothetical protein ASF90_06385 [Xanthomonas sp. Leaf148]